MAECGEMGFKVCDVPTPSFLVDIDKLKRNAERMIQRCEEFGVKLRPHMKTHKTLEAAVLMTKGTKRCIVVSTLQEAEFYAEDGFDDILYGCLITESKIERCRKLANRLQEFHLLLDSQYALDVLRKSSLIGGKKWSVYLKVNCGYGRAGVDWDSPDGVTLAKAVVGSENVKLHGLYTHCGNSYDTRSEDALRKVEVETTERLVFLRDRLKGEGIENLEVGTGSTPSCSRPVEELRVLTELHPGNYVFYDWMQSCLGSCSLDDVACRIATRVIGHYPQRKQLLIDAGFTALSHDGLKDNLPMKTGFTFIQGHPELKITGMTQEVGYVRAVEGDLDFDKYPLGSLLYIYPFHSCATAALHPVYYVHSGEIVQDVWTPTRGW